MNIPFTLEELRKAGKVTRFLDTYCETLHAVLKHPNYYDGWEFDDSYIRIKNSVWSQFTECEETGYELISIEELFDKDALIEARLAEIKREEDERQAFLIRKKQHEEKAAEERERQEFERLKKKFS